MVSGRFTMDSLYLENLKLSVLALNVLELVEPVKLLNHISETKFQVILCSDQITDFDQRD